MRKYPKVKPTYTGKPTFIHLIYTPVLTTIVNDSYNKLGYIGIYHGFTLNNNFLKIQV